MDEKTMRGAGFGVEVDLVKQGRCPFCKKEIDPNEFTDELSYKEYLISGLCQLCQRDVFGE